MSGTAREPDNIDLTHTHSYIRSALVLTMIILLAGCNPRLSNGLRKHDLGKDVEIVTDHGTMLIRLSDSTPLHRDNFLRLVKSRFYQGVSFHRVIRNFMIQAGDPLTKTSQQQKKSDSSYRQRTIPAEFNPTLFHKKGALAAARTGDDVNPKKASSSTQFYLVQGRIFNDFSLDSIETSRLKGRKLPTSHRQFYKTIGGAPHLDGNYTVFGQVITGLEVIDSIAAEPTSGNAAANRPLKEIKILKVRLVDRVVRKAKKRKEKNNPEG